LLAEQQILTDVRDLLPAKAPLAGGFRSKRATGFWMTSGAAGRSSGRGDRWAAREGGFVR
jgi:hypothetical protein